MAVRIIKEVNRSEGRKPVTGVTIIAGEVLVLATNLETKPYDDGTFAAVPYGVAAEDTTQLPLAAANGLTAGQAFDYTNFNRGGLVGAFVNGSELELYDDGHGVPYVSGDTYALNAPVFTSSAGKVTVTSNAAGKVGSVVDFDVATNPKRLRIKFVI